MKNGAVPLTDRIAIGLADFVVRRRWLVLFVALLGVIAAASGLGRLEVVNNYRVFFGPDNPELIAFDRFQHTYSRNDNLLFVVKPKTGDVFAPEHLTAIEELTRGAWTLPFATRVDSLTNFQYSRARQGELTVDDMFRNAAAMSEADLAERRAASLSEPLLADYLLSRDASTTGVNVVFIFPEKSLTEVPETMAAGRELAARIVGEFPDIELVVTGGVAMNAAFSEASLTDGKTLYPIMLVVLILVTALILRSVVATAVTMTVVVFSTMSAVGIAGYAGWPVSPVSSGAPVVIMTLAIADSIHILISMFALMRQGLDQTAALKESLRINFLAVTATSVTTMVGFLALNFTDTPPFHHLGNATATGIAAAWALSLTFLPAAIAILPLRARLRGPGGTAAMTAFAQFVIRFHRRIVILVGLTAVGLIALIPTIELNDEWVEYFDKRLQFRRDAEFARENLTGLYLIEYSVPSTGSGGISEPAYLRNLDAFTTWLRAQSEVRHVFSYVDIAKRLNRNMHGDDPDYHRLPESRDLAAQYLLLYELSLPFGLDLTDRISTDKSATRVTATLNNISMVEVRAFVARSDAWFEANAPPEMRTPATGATIMFAHISERNMRAMMFGNMMAILLITVIMAATMRSLPFGLFSLIPNAVPILMTFGVWALLVGEAGLAVATVTATSLGIIVDNTVHYLTKYLRARREQGLGPRGAVVYAFETVGLAILANAVILTAGFAVLAFSTFRVTTEMGMLTAIAIVIALTVDFLLLPALLLLGRSRSEEKEFAELA